MDDSYNCKMESVLQNAADQQQTVCGGKKKNVAANVEAFRKNCCFNKFTTEVESAFPRFSRCVEGAKVADRTQTALDECSRRHRFALNSISHFSISARFQGQHNFEKKKIAVEIPLRIPTHTIIIIPLRKCSF